MAGKSFRRGRADDVWLPWFRHGDSVKGLTTLGQLTIGAEGLLHSRTVGAGIPDRHDAICRWVRQWLEQYWVHRAEDCGGGADAQCQREDSNQREAGILREVSETEANIFDY